MSAAIIRPAEHLHATARRLYETADALPRASPIRAILLRRAAELQQREEGRAARRPHGGLLYRRLVVAGALARHTYSSMPA